MLGNPTAWSWQINRSNGTLVWLVGDSTPGATFGGDRSLVIGGIAQKPGGGPWDPPSDIRVKKDIKPYSRGLSDILAYEPIAFRYDNDDPKVYVGRSAQAVREVDGSMVYTRDHMGIDDFQFIDVNPDIYKVFNAIRTLHDRISDLESHTRAT